jgi:hypothetical protein
MPSKSSAALQRLADAISSDRMSRKVSSSLALDDVRHVINAALVLSGARPVARLEAHSVPAFWAELKRYRPSHDLLDTNGNEAEPLLVDRRHAARLGLADDLRVVTNKEHSSASDLAEPLLGAFRRILRYPCRMPRATRRTGTVTRPRLEFMVLVQDVETGARIELVQLGACVCTRADMRGAARASKMQQATTEWVAPACRALAGTAFTLHGRKYIVNGFSARVNQLRHKHAYTDSH